MKKAVIFDFDGTIADTFLVALAIFYQVTGKGEVPRHEVDRLRSMTLLRAAAALDLPLWKAPLLLRKGRQLLAEQITQVELFDGVPEALRQLKADGYDLHIISLNSEPNIRRLLALHQLEDLFTTIEGRSRLRSKASIIRRLQRQHKLAARHIVYVGDEARDVHAAHHANVPAVAVSWGYNNLHLLEQSKPEELILSPEEIVPAVRKLTT